LETNPKHEEASPKQSQAAARIKSEASLNGDRRKANATVCRIIRNWPDNRRKRCRLAWRAQLRAGRAAGAVSSRWQGGTRRLPSWRVIPLGELRPRNHRRTGARG